MSACARGASASGNTSATATVTLPLAASSAMVRKTATLRIAAVPAENGIPSWCADGSAMVTMRVLPPRSSIESGSAPLPAASKTASTGAPSARTRATRPSPYTTGVAPSDAKSAWLAALPVAYGDAQARQLHGDAAHDASAAVDQQHLAALHGQRVEHAGGGLAGDRQRGGQLPREALGLLGHDRGHRQLGVGAALGQAEDLVAGGELGHAGADLVDHAGELDAEQRRQRRAKHRLHGAGAHLGVEQIHADRAHAHAHLAAAGVRLGRLGRVEHLGAAESIDLHGLHVVPPYAKVCVAAAPDALLSRPWMWMHRYRIRFLTSSILMSSSYQEASWASHSTYS